jgi:predicted enzyme involved in methoxymalonyl-ACP biosynthesis
MKDLKYIDILKKNQELAKINFKQNISINILSNITVNKFKEIMEYEIRSSGIGCNVAIGEYDNIIQDTFKINKDHVTIIFFELLNYYPQIYLSVNFFTDEELKKLITKITDDIRIIFNNLAVHKQVILNNISKLHFSNSVLSKNNYDILTESINAFINNNKPDNFTIIDMDKVLSKIGLDRAVDMRGFYSSKSLYTIDFIKEYSTSVCPRIKASYCSIKKVLVLDCDNTLWGGILGEDGGEKIQMSPHSYPGNIFFEVQQLALLLNKKGVLLALCSKNNFEDVEKIITENKDFQIPSNAFSALKINWNDKV